MTLESCIKAPPPPKFDFGCEIPKTASRPVRLLGGWDSTVAEPIRPA